jgi:hypothetical protein
MNYRVETQPILAKRPYYCSKPVEESSETTV